MPHQCTNCGRTFADGSKEMLSGCPDCSGTKFQFDPDGFDDEATASTADTASPTPVDETFESDTPGEAVSRTVGSAAATVRDLVGGSAGPDATAASPPSSAGSEASTASTTAADRDDDIIVAESEPLEESDAQADARSELVSPDEMPEAGGFDPTTDGIDKRAGDRPRTDVGKDGHRDVATDHDGAGATDDSRANPDDDAHGDAPAESSDRSVTSEPDAETVDRPVAEEPDAEQTDRPNLSQLREELNDQFESIRVVEPGQYELNLMELYDREEYIIALQEDGRYSIQVPETWRDADA